jgi:hypothetical protein
MRLLEPQLKGLPTIARLLILVKKGVIKTPNRGKRKLPRLPLNTNLATNKPAFSEEQNRD